MAISVIENASFGNSGIITANGIKFPATQVASADANTLDDYEEGTWTPTFTGGGIAGTNLVYSGSYTKIGRMVVINIEITSSTSSNNVYISSYAVFSGVPFAPSGLKGNGSATTEDIDLYDRNGFSQLSSASSSILISKAGAASGTNTIYATATYFTS
jgi:hypothetical protein